MQAMKLLRLLAAMAASMIAVTAQAQQIGIVMLHGKWGSPAGPMQPLELALRGGGYRVIARPMAWSDTRAYDQTLDDALLEIDRQVNEVRSAGAGKIVVAGQSLGGNVALAYAARHPELDGLIVLSPGHTPERMARNPKIADSLRKAHALLAGGGASQFANFEDFNQGRERQVSAKPAVYISFFDPNGDAVMPRNAAKVSLHTAVLWVVGRRDQMFSEGTRYAFDRLPKNQSSSYRTVEADHFGAPSAARDIVLQWIRALP
jgi:pimeloyl-ACP methyl ester carboxylesterase